MDKAPLTPEASLEDLRAIRYMLDRYEEKPILEAWAFFTWAVIIGIGTLINWIMHTMQPITVHASFMKIWVPLILIGIIFESIAFFRRFKKDQIPLNAKSFIKTIIFLMSFFCVSFCIIFSLIATNAPLPGILLAWISNSFFLIGYLSYSSLYYNALMLFIASLPFLLGNWTSPKAYLFSGILTAVFFVAGGIQYSLAGRRNNE